jgi:hypothetical protein
VGRVLRGVDGVMMTVGRVGVVWFIFNMWTLCPGVGEQLI